MSSLARMLEVLSCAIVIGLASCNGGATSPAPSGPITVKGRVVTGKLAPLPNTPVAIEGHVPVLTDDNGAFEIPEVEAPYDVTIVEETSSTVTIYRGLSRPDPTLFAFAYTAGPNQPRGASLSGNVTGGTTGPTHVTRVYPSAVHSSRSGSTTANNVTGSYSTGGFLGWAGPEESTLVVHALQWEAGSSLPKTFSAYGKSTLHVTDGTSHSADITMQPVGTATLSGTIASASGTDVAWVRSRVRTGSDAYMDLPLDLSGSSSFSFHMPAIVDATYELQVSGGTQLGFSQLTRQNLVGDNMGLVLELPPHPVPILPPADATGVDTNTAFSFSGVADAVHVFQFTGGPSSQLAIYVVTEEDQILLPDLSPFGLELSPDKAHSWSVRGYGPLASMDQATGPESLFPSTDTRFEAATYGLGFTTAP